MTPTQALIEIDEHKRDVAELDQDYGKILCEHIGNINKKIYKFSRYVAKRGESITIKVCENFVDGQGEKINRDALLKIALPNIAGNPKICDEPYYLRLSRHLLPRERRKQDIFTRSVERFLNSGYTQKKVYEVAKSYNFRYGYIPSVFDISKEDGFPYIAMEFFDTVDLLFWLKSQNNISRFIFFRNCVQLVKNYLHESHIAHCDIAIDNVLIFNGLPVLIDFGIHKDFSTDTDLTHLGEKMGKILYRSPELAEDARERGFWTDIYMLGIFLWVVWNAEIPREATLLFSGSNSKGYFPNSDLPQALRVIFGKATKENPADRYTCLQEMLIDIDYAYKEILPKLKRNLLFDDSWKKYVTHKTYVPVLEEIFNIIKNG